MYVPVDKDKKEDLLYYNNEANTAEFDAHGPKIQVYDSVDPSAIKLEVK